jgi:anthranilate synthase component 1
MWCTKKHRAMQLIEEYENKSEFLWRRNIGVMDFDGNFNHAINPKFFKQKSSIALSGWCMLESSDEESECKKYTIN